MSLLIAWVAFPAVLSLLAVGSGLLVRSITGGALAGALVPTTGLALLIVVGQFVALADATAELFVPLAVALALVGLVAASRSLPRPDPWIAPSVVAVFGVYAAPIVLSGEATFAGYIRLDDTATWMALTDRVLEHGRDLDGLAPSTFEATLSFNLADGYPIGVFLPLGAAARLVGEDVAWVIQPYMAWMAVLLALAIWSLARPLVASARLRAGITVVAAQPALLYGYYLWGGIKELAAAALIAAACASLAGLVAARFARRALLAPALIAAALIGVLSPGGAIWLLPAGLVAVWVGTRALGGANLGRRLGLALIVVVLLALPALVGGGLLPPTSAPLSAADAYGNLLGALDPAQVAGIWPAGDLRLEPASGLPTRLAIVAILLGAAGGIAVAARARAWAALAYGAGTIAAGALIWLLGSPWVDGKALATVSPAVLFAAGIAIAALFAAGRPGSAAMLACVAIAGVVGSNALAYRDASLAPRDQLAELERIGKRISGQGPTLITEYQPYGARHFLRDADPEAASELRRRLIPLAGGGALPKGRSADTDALEPAGLAVYRTVVVRHSPVDSRPPAAYRRTWAGDFYEVWQRPPGPATPAPRIAVGDDGRPTGRPDCARVVRLARAAGTQGLVAAAGERSLTIPLARTMHPRPWSSPGLGSSLVPEGGGTVAAEVWIERPGRYEVWLGGSLRAAAELVVDEEVVGSVRHQLNNDGQYVLLGITGLDRGRHRVAIAISGADLHPGSGGPAPAIGPLVVASAADGDGLLRVDARDARSLCERELDWIEVASG